MNGKITSPVVLAKELVKTYRDGLTAVDGIDFEILPGECFGFLGPNGAGKTTTIKMIYGMIPPTSGSLNVLGLDMTTNPRRAKTRIGVIPEETNLDWDLTVLENLEIYANYFDIKKKDARQKAVSLLGFSGLEEKITASIDELSSGMKQRLLLARALINDPELLILDEPTVGLDPQMRHIIWEKLRILKSQGVTQILTTHYMEEASQLCDRIAIMNRGKIIEQGKPADLVAKHPRANLEEVFLKLTGRRLHE